jgi:FixJ family two-component response regulator
VTTSAQTIFLVDDDAGVLRALSRVLREEGWNVQTFESAEAFLARHDPGVCDCLVVDVTMPGIDGLELQRRLAEAGQSPPMVFVTGHDDIPLSVQAIKAGATDFLTKPVQAQALVNAVRLAIEEHASEKLAREATEDLQRRLATLTPREREVLVALAAGKLNKQIASDLGVVEQTVKFHRARIMERMQAKTLAELMHIAAQLGITAVSARSQAGSASEVPQKRPGSGQD